MTKWVQITIDDVAELDSLVPHIKASYELALDESD